MKAKYESHALGMCFGMFSTWMNGIISNYGSKPGLYIDGPVEYRHEQDANGNFLYMDKNGIECYELVDENGNKHYYYSETNEEVNDIEGLVPIREGIPRVVQGILYTLKDVANVFTKGGGGLKAFKEEIWGDDM
jgi:hypothetical protein